MLRLFLWIFRRLFLRWFLCESFRFFFFQWWQTFSTIPLNISQSQNSEISPKNIWVMRFIFMESFRLFLYEYLGQFFWKPQTIPLETQKFSKRLDKRINKGIPIFKNQPQAYRHGIAGRIWNRILKDDSQKKNFLRISQRNCRINLHQNNLKSFQSCKGNFF